MLAGEAGPGAQKAIEIVVALGRIYGAADLVPVASVQVSGVSYKNLGDAGLEFLQAWAAQGAQARVPATLNPAGMDLAAWAELGFSPEFARRQQAVVAAYEALGVLPTCTCAPYLIGHEPAFGQHIAWAESSAVSFANSVLGARTNREGGPSALAAAVAGRTARYGFHLDAHRQPTLLVDVRCPVRSEADLGALGYLVGRHARTGVPYFRALDPNEPMIGLMRDLRRREFRMALLTNNVREWEPLWRSMLPVDEIFELIVDSAFVGMRKPEPEIYELTVERIGGVTASECVFVDDTEINCEVAREMGMSAVRFRDNEQAIAEIERTVAGSG